MFNTNPTFLIFCKKNNTQQNFKFSEFQKLNVRAVVYNFSIFQITRSDVHLGVPNKRKGATKTTLIKDTGKSSSRKLRRAIYYTLYRMDPQKTN